MKGRMAVRASTVTNMSDGGLLHAMAWNLPGEDDVGCNTEEYTVEERG